MSSVTDLLTKDNAVFTAYLFWSSVLALKMLGMSLLTGSQRFRTKTFANPEDCMSKHDKVKFDNADVERVRRAHRNDMENILPFFVVGFLYLLTNPAAYLAVNIYRAVAISRIIHTLVYAVIVLPQPARAISFFVPFLCTAYMAFQIVIYTF